jgi:hypothetical protein
MELRAGARWPGAQQSAIPALEAVPDVSSRAPVTPADTTPGPAALLATSPSRGGAGICGRRELSLAACGLGAPGSRTAELGVAAATAGCVFPTSPHARTSAPINPPGATGSGSCWPDVGDGLIRGAPISAPDSTGAAAAEPGAEFSGGSSPILSSELSAGSAQTGNGASRRLTAQPLASRTVSADRRARRAEKTGATFFTSTMVQCCERRPETQVEDDTGMIRNRSILFPRFFPIRRRERVELVAHGIPKRWRLSAIRGHVSQCTPERRSPATLPVRVATEPSHIHGGQTGSD